MNKGLMHHVLGGETVSAEPKAVPRGIMPAPVAGPVKTPPPKIGKRPKVKRGAKAER